MEVDAYINNLDCVGESREIQVKLAVPIELNIVDLQTNENAIQPSTPPLELSSTQAQASASLTDLNLRKKVHLDEGSSRHARAPPSNDKCSYDSDIPSSRSSPIAVGHRNQLSTSVMRKLGTAYLPPLSSSVEYRKANLVDSERKMSHVVADTTSLNDDDIEVQLEGRSAKRRAIEEEAVKMEGEDGVKEFLDSESESVGLAPSLAAMVATSTTTRATAAHEESDESRAPGAVSTPKDLDALLRETRDICDLAYRGSFRPEEAEFIEEEDGSLVFDLGSHFRRDEIVRIFVTGLVEKKSDRWAVSFHGRDAALGSGLVGSAGSSAAPLSLSSSTGPVCGTTPAPILGSSSSSISASGFGTVPLNDLNISRPPITAINRADLPHSTVPLDLSKLKTFVSVRRRETDASQRTFYSIRTRTCSIAHAIFVGDLDQILALAKKTVIPLFKPSHTQAGIDALEEHNNSVQLEDYGAATLDESTVWLCLHLKNAKDPAHLRPHLDDKEIPIRLFRLPYTHYYALSFEYAVFASETKLTNVGGREVCIQLDVLTAGVLPGRAYQLATAGCEVIIDVQLSGLKKQAAAMAEAMAEEQFEAVPNSPSHRGAKPSKGVKNTKASKKRQASQQRRVEAHVHGKRFANKGTPSLHPAARARLLADLNSAALPKVPLDSVGSQGNSQSSRKLILFKPAASSSSARRDTSQTSLVASPTTPVLGSVSRPAAPPRSAAAPSIPSHFPSSMPAATLFPAAPLPSNGLQHFSPALYGINMPNSTNSTSNLDQTQATSPTSSKKVASLSSASDPSRSPQRLGEPKRRVQETHLRPMGDLSSDFSTPGGARIAEAPPSGTSLNSSLNIPFGYPYNVSASPFLYNPNSVPTLPSTIPPNLEAIMQLAAYNGQPIYIPSMFMAPELTNPSNRLSEMSSYPLRHSTSQSSSFNGLSSSSSSLPSPTVPYPSLPFNFNASMSFMNSNPEFTMNMLASMSTPLGPIVPTVASASTSNPSTPHPSPAFPLITNPYIHSASLSSMMPGLMTQPNQLGTWSSFTPTSEQNSSQAASSPQFPYGAYQRPQ